MEDEIDKVARALETMNTDYAEWAEEWDTLVNAWDFDFEAARVITDSVERLARLEQLRDEYQPIKISKKRGDTLIEQVKVLTERLRSLVKKRLH